MRCEIDVTLFCGLDRAGSVIALTVGICGHAHHYATRQITSHRHLSVSRLNTLTVRDWTDLALHSGDELR
jgi:hypothetical protein